MNKWIQTDSNQFIQKETETIYNTIEIIGIPETEFSICFQNINLDDYTDDIPEIISAYGYSDIAEIIEIYGDAANQIIAECISETEAISNADSNNSFVTIEEAITYVKNYII